MTATAGMPELHVPRLAVIPAWWAPFFLNRKSPKEALDMMASLVAGLATQPQRDATEPLMDWCKSSCVRERSDRRNPSACRVVLSIPEKRQQTISEEAIWVVQFTKKTHQSCSLVTFHASSSWVGQVDASVIAAKQLSYCRSGRFCGAVIVHITINISTWEQLGNVVDWWIWLTLGCQSPSISSHLLRRDTF